MSKSGRDNSKGTGRSNRAAEIRAQQARKERNRNLGIAGVVVLALGAIIAAVVIGTQKSTTPTVKLSDVPVAAADQALVMGKDSAPVKVVVYEDFLCPYCRQFENTSRSFLQEGASAGKVQVEYRPFQLLQDDYSAEVLNTFGAILRKSTPQKALAFHDYAFDNQPYESDSDKPDLQDMLKWAQAVGADEDGVTDGIENRDEEFAKAANKAAADKGVSGTPTVYLNGKKLSGDPQQMADTIERAIAEAK